MNSSDMPASNLPWETVSQILDEFRGENGAIFLWATCRNVSRAWRVLVETKFRKIYLPDTRIEFEAGMQ